MIYQTRIGEGISVTLDDEMCDERPTPEMCRDYLKAVGDEALRIYTALPDAAEVSATDDGDT